MQKIIPNLWFDKEAEEAAEFYVSLFNNSRVGSVTRYGKEGFEHHQQPEGTAMTVEIELEGFKMLALNGGPLFSFTPAVSFFVTFDTVAEVESLWGKLKTEGVVMMPLNKYDWSEKYGWVQDKYGVSWQISVGKQEDAGQRITPSLMFVGEKGRAEEAIKHYTSTFRDSQVNGILRYSSGEEQPEGLVKHAQFQLNGQTFMAMDTIPKFADFTFNEAISLIVICKSQEEIDHFWERLSQDGEEGPCGWLKDKFGVSWQVVPEILSKMLKDQDSVKVARVTKAFMQMKKFDIAKLQEAFSAEPSLK